MRLQPPVAAQDDSLLHSPSHGLAGVGLDICPVDKLGTPKFYTWNMETGDPYVVGNTLKNPPMAVTRVPETDTFYLLDAEHGTMHLLDQDGKDLVEPADHYYQQNYWIWDLAYSIRELVLYTLNNSGLEARGFETPRAFWRALEQEVPQLIMLDIMLPEEDGLQILRKIRAGGPWKGIPVMMLTAKGTEYDKVIGLDAGADDYVPKPFGMMELLARVRALLRRSGGKQSQAEYAVGPLYVCPARHVVRVNGQDVTLTLKEYEVLKMLLENQDVVLTRDQLLNRIWGYSFDGESRTVDVHIRTLRQKLMEAGELIETVRGVGYVFRDAEA